MARPTIPAAILAQRGVQIPLAEGFGTATLCYTFASLMVLEEEFGSVTKAFESISSTDAAQFGGVVALLAAGLAHEVAPPQYDGVPLSDRDMLAAMLDPRELQAYVEAIGEAIKAAFPQAAEGSPDPTEQATTPDPSPGESGTTSPAASGLSPLMSSGV
jgi:hypothetical protein